MPLLDSTDMTEDFRKLGMYCRLLCSLASGCASRDTHCNCGPLSIGSYQLCLCLVMVNKWTAFDRPRAGLIR